MRSEHIGIVNRDQIARVARWQSAPKNMRALHRII
jgi:hypothetical protein